MLSDKAKGKLRAVDAPESSESPPRELVVRFTEGEQDLVLSVTEKDAVRDVKRMIRNSRPHLQRNRLRLIHSGRMLTDGVYIYSWLSTLEERQQRTAPSSSIVDGKDLAVTAPSSITWVHCSVGPVLEEGEEESSSAQSSQIQPLRGFDRLTAAGLTAEDIAGIRRQFHTRSDADYISGNSDDDEHARALEEQWIDSLDNPTLADSPSTSSSVLQGLIVGFFFPILPIFFMWEAKPAVFWLNGTPAASQGSVIFSKRMQMGIVVGAAMNVLFAIWRYLLGST